MTMPVEFWEDREVVLTNLIAVARQHDSDPEAVNELKGALDDVRHRIADAEARKE